ncbi:hypothetical protein GCM10007423_21070 [Dyadobacter endophyticus]|uniref:FAD-binding domain-containing protein n=1 Tax=Dyadobacter endophyticus TaxID=1749036 RepID=A0ABQ1YMY5_9BACT|nr:FAD-dependent monooxygenase [Dyadobacter endophyticus]GGH31897.1 hypothetical protein GCM10007423_21070 [Dyadobacter endophyticus]
MEHTTPVVIAGGGIAGMATALSLINRGVGCLVVEPEIALTAKIGETIPPNATSILARAGIDHLMVDPAHLPCYGNHFVWGSDVPYEKSFFTQVNPHGWHLDRPFFEKQLRTHCISRGIGWLSGHRVTYIEQLPDRWQVSLDGEQNATVSCSFLVDATGRQARIARILGRKRKRLDALVGISAQLTVGDTMLRQNTFIEAVANGWWYAAPLSNHKLSIAYMTDNDLVDKELMNTNHFMAFAQSSTNKLISNLLKKPIACNAEEITLRPASTSMLDERTGNRWLAVGDAAYSFDPISSYGIMSALEGGYYAGHAIADTLAGHTDALLAYDVIISQAFDIYLQMHSQQYSAEQRWAGLPFWNRRKVG